MSQVSAPAKVESGAPFAQVLRQGVESEEAFAENRQGPIVQKIGEQLLPLLDARPSFKDFRATVMAQG